MVTYVLKFVGLRHSKIGTLLTTFRTACADLQVKVQGRYYFQCWFGKKENIEERCFLALSPGPFPPPPSEAWEQGYVVSRPVMGLGD